MGRSQLVDPGETPVNKEAGPTPSLAITLATVTPRSVGVFMVTCLVCFTDSRGGLGGAASNFGRGITRIFYHGGRLDCAQVYMPISILGVGNISIRSQRVCDLNVQTLNGESVAASHMCVVLPKITLNTPPFLTILEVKAATHHLVLADR